MPVKYVCLRALANVRVYTVVCMYIYMYAYKVVCMSIYMRAFMHMCTQCFAIPILRSGHPLADSHLISISQPTT